MYREETTQEQSVVIYLGLSADQVCQLELAGRCYDTPQGLMLADTLFQKFLRPVCKAQDMRTNGTGKYFEDLPGPRGLSRCRG